MPRKPIDPDQPIRGGSGTARARGLTGIVVYVDPEQKRALRLAAADRGVPLAHFVRDAAVEIASKVNSDSDLKHFRKKD